MTYSADAIAILATERCPEDIAAALDAELTEIETSDEYARLEREMATQTPCHVDPKHGAATMIVTGQRYLCSSCAYAWTLNQHQKRLPVGVARGGTR